MRDISAIYYIFLFIFSWQCLLFPVSQCITAAWRRFVINRKLAKRALCSGLFSVQCVFWGRLTSCFAPGWLRGQKTSRIYSDRHFLRACIGFKMCVVYTANTRWQNGLLASAYRVHTAKLKRILFSTLRSILNYGILRYITHTHTHTHTGRAQLLVDLRTPVAIADRCWTVRASSRTSIVIFIARYWC